MSPKPSQIRKDQMREFDQIIIFKLCRFTHRLRSSSGQKPFAHLTSLDVPCPMMQQFSSCSGPPSRIPPFREGSKPIHSSSPGHVLSGPELLRPKHSRYFRMQTFLRNALRFAQFAAMISNKRMKESAQVRVIAARDCWPS
jgi:hypothetical protein